MAFDTTGRMLQITAGALSYVGDHPRRRHVRNKETVLPINRRCVIAPLTNNMVGPCAVRTHAIPNRTPLNDWGGVVFSG